MVHVLYRYEIIYSEYIYIWQQQKSLTLVYLLADIYFTEQSKILQKVQEFYSKLFENKDNSLKSVATSKIPELQYFKKNDSSNLGGEITTHELGKALKKMKNNKSPGIDGISADFLKVFWVKLKYHIKNAINSSYIKGTLPISWRQSIITCLPKGNKPRQFLKNWRPISLLRAVYKLISGVIAERIKPCLDKIISKDTVHIFNRNWSHWKLLFES